MEDEECAMMFIHLQQYVPLLDKLISQMKKLEVLHSMITDKKNKLQLDTAIKVEDEILKIITKVNPNIVRQLKRYVPLHDSIPMVCAVNESIQEKSLRPPMKPKENAVIKSKPKNVADPPKNHVLVQAHKTTVSTPQSTVVKYRPKNLNETISKEAEVVNNSTDNDVIIVSDDEEDKPAQPIIPNSSNSQTVQNFQDVSHNSTMSMICEPDQINTLPIQPIFSDYIACSVCGYKSKVRTHLVRHFKLHLLSKHMPPVPASAPVHPVRILTEFFEGTSDISVIEDVHEEPFKDVTFVKHQSARPGVKRSVPSCSNVSHSACEAEAPIPPPKKIKVTARKSTTKPSLAIAPPIEEGL